MYVCMYVCMCVCVCVRVSESRKGLSFLSVKGVNHELGLFHVACAQGLPLRGNWGSARFPPRCPSSPGTVEHQASHCHPLQRPSALVTLTLTLSLSLSLSLSCISIHTVNLFISISLSISISLPTSFVYFMTLCDQTLSFTYLLEMPQYSVPSVRFASGFLGHGNRTV